MAYKIEAPMCHYVPRATVGDFWRIAYSLSAAKPNLLEKNPNSIRQRNTEFWNLGLGLGFGLGLGLGLEVPSWLTAKYMCNRAERSRGGVIFDAESNGEVRFPIRSRYMHDPPLNWTN